MELTGASYPEQVLLSHCLRQTRHRALPRVCVFSRARCVCVCPHVLGRCNDALFHRCISRFTDSTDVSIHSSIHQCIECVRCGSFVILSQYFSILLCRCFVNIGVEFGVILLVWGSILTLFLCPWASFGDPLPSRAPPRGAEAKM